MASAGQAHAHSSQPMHFSSPSGHRLSWWWPWNRGAVGFLTSGYSTVSTFRNISVKVTPNPLIGLRKSSTCDLPAGGFVTDIDAVVVRQVERRHREGGGRHLAGSGYPGPFGPFGLAADAPAMAVNRAARCCAELSHIVIRPKMSTMTTPKTTYGAVEWLSRRQARTVATSRSQMMETGMRTFQPIAMSWSYLTRGSVPRS